MLDDLSEPKAAEETLRVRSELFKSGKATSTDLIDAETEVKEKEARIADLKAKAEFATKPEEKKAQDDLLAELAKLKGEAEERVKIADANEKAFLLKADEKKSEVDALGAKLQEKKDKK